MRLLTCLTLLALMSLSLAVRSRFRGRQEEVSDNLRRLEERAEESEDKINNSLGQLLDLANSVFSQRDDLCNKLGPNFDMIAESIEKAEGKAGRKFDKIDGQREQLSQYRTRCGAGQAPKTSAKSKMSNYKKSKRRSLQKREI
eukprot:TRINITY_DN3199_c0_g1_i12.p1 TRINITY_DN3199_c0_g1~~TRINITY_DN3199_c0_g1_i12.p1  ORF type:complete len:143 (+),score=37.64 TRINITY_DN3199_c0_g1_i12:121-549(+)